MEKHKEITARKRIFQKGERVIIITTIQDSFTPLPKGLQGTVSHVDDIGTVHVHWDNGSNLGALLEDQIALI
ncbi:uncharacterized protein DUF4314 [Ureibacillus xyleni]|uniref:Uncharacterized protein DUF4314 n=1 Tax=Ureibacillus xyleni TaxID=614648 RepID=A0A285TMJ4_9BACL|nr:DUF4314 domain-containing protein [Ureibacillus xyleni]SOC21991.1 uncharacterized protein DUF4314 [Ureibacillus xyleni]